VGHVTLASRDTTPGALLTFCHCACGCSYEHRVLLAGKSGGDAWLDRSLLQKIFSRQGRVLDVFLPYGRKVRAIGHLHAVWEG
jgi:hypothetical protein